MLDELFHDVPLPPCLVFQDPDEDNKAISTVDRFLDFLFDNEADRHSLLIAIGGGVTLDTAGFAASVFKRGISWVAIPTTLLAQVDASVGGKTAINHAAAKNAIGSFHPPVEVVISPNAAHGWQKYHYLEGIAEMYKIFALFDDAAARDLVESGLNDILTTRSVELKCDIVDLDPWENDLRAALNYGHTFGHALEHAGAMRHGIAVAYGIMIENIVAERLSIMSRTNKQRVYAELRQLGFSDHKCFPPFDSLLPFILQDKKNISGSVLLSLSSGAGDLRMENRNPCVGADIALLRASYEAFLAET
jgi:3-dehydroquinate synthase